MGENIGKVETDSWKVGYGTGQDDMEQIDGMGWKFDLTHNSPKYLE